MKDEFTPKDLQFENIKDIFQKELRGLSLNQMEISKVSGGLEEETPFHASLTTAFTHLIANGDGPRSIKGETSYDQCRS